MKEAVWDRDPEIPVKVMEYDPAGADVEVERVRVELHVGVQDAAENDAVVPVGRPEAENETDCAVPETSVVVTVFVAD